MDFRFDYIIEYRDMFDTAIKLTLGLTAVAIIAGTVIGMLGALASVARIEKGNFLTRTSVFLIRNIVRLYVTVFRGTPLFVQILIWYFVWFPVLIHVDNGIIVSGPQATVIRQQYGAIIAGALALSVNAGAYITEIFRGGIQSIDRGQMEAARSSGLSYFQAMRYIILPQALRRMLPPLGNEFITLLKDSSLLSVIAVAELAYVAKSISGRYAHFETPYYAIALIYLAMTIVLTWLFGYLEKRYKVSHH